jgi:hypothetical protein
VEKRKKISQFRLEASKRLELAAYMGIGYRSPGGRVREEDAKFVR